MKKKAAVIFGGISSEHEISCRSVINIANGFQKEKYDLRFIGITKDGKWLLVDDISQIADDSWRSGATTAILSPDRHRPGILILRENTYEYEKIDVIFPALHGIFGEDGTVQGLFELSGIP